MKAQLKAALAVGLICTSGAAAQTYLGEIKITAGATCPQGWESPDEQTLQIRDNPQLFALIGTQFGGDGRTTFKLPDFRARSPIGAGGSQASGVGEVGGSDHFAIRPPNIPAHHHRLVATNVDGTMLTPEGNSLAEFVNGTYQAYSTNAPGPETMSPWVMSDWGTDYPDPISIRQPGLGVWFCISTTDGRFPSRGRAGEAEQ